MATREIAQREWGSFLDEFSRQHREEMVSVEVIGDDVGAQPEAEALPLVGISADDKGSEAGTISVLLGTEPEDHAEHRIDAPTHLWLKSTGDQAKDALEIEAADGTKTIIQMQSPSLLAPKS